MSSPHDRGKKALASKDYPLAIHEFTTAITASPSSPIYHLDRSTAHLRNTPNNTNNPNNPTTPNLSLHLALLDAEAALILAKARDRGEIIGKAQFRRGVVLFHLGRYGDAGRCFGWAKERDPGEKMVGIWEVKVRGRLAAGNGEGEGDGDGVLEYPEGNVVRRAQGSKVATTTATTATTTTTTTTTSTPASVSAPKELAVSTPPSQIRHDWYQSNDTVTISLMVKGVPKDKANIEIEKTSISISFPLPTGSDYNFSLDPLYASIDPAQSTFKTLSTKIELILKKSSPGTKWHSIEGEAPIINDADSTATTTDFKPSPLITSGPLYPSSSKTGPKNWDKVVSNLSKKPKPKVTASPPTTTPTTSASNDKPSSPTPQPEDPEHSDPSYISEDEDEDGAGGDPVNSFFKKLFKNADPDTRRAMMKSYTESNGTALSTNWDEVRKAPVETRPPEGMEEVRYEK